MEFVSEESQVVLVDFGSKVEIRSLPCDFEKPGDLLNVLNVVQLIKLPVSRNAYECIRDSVPVYVVETENFEIILRNLKVLINAFNVNLFQPEN